MTRYATIISTAHYLPERKITNEDLDKHFTSIGIPDVVRKFAEASGITQRFYAPEEWCTSDLALPAAQEALKRAGRKPEDVDLIILGTDSPDYITPATSVVLQYKLGAKNAGTFDISCACASFPAAIASASGIIAINPSIKTVLVVGAYMMHKLCDPNDPTIFFYGDGAGAVVMEGGPKPGFIGTAMQADGSFHPNWGIYSGGTFEPASEESVKAGRTKVKLVRRYPLEVNREGWTNLFHRLAKENNFTSNDVDQIIFTQVSKPTIEFVAQACGVPVEKCHMVMDKWGYTGSSSIAMAFDDAVTSEKIKSGDLVVMIGSGVGYNQASVAFRMG